MDRTGLRWLDRAGTRWLERADLRWLDRAGTRWLERTDLRWLERADLRWLERADLRWLDRTDWAGSRWLDRGTSSRYAMSVSRIPKIASNVAQRDTADNHRSEGPGSMLGWLVGASVATTAWKVMASGENGSDRQQRDTTGLKLLENLSRDWSWWVLGSVRRTGPTELGPRRGEIVTRPPQRTTNLNLL